MRLVIVFIALCLIRKSLQIVEFYEEKTTMVNQLACVNTALKKYLEDHRIVWIFSTISISPMNILLEVPVSLITEWDFLRERLFVDPGAMIIFLEGNPHQDFKGLKRLEGVVLVRPILIACITDVVCSSDLYMKKIVEILIDPELHYLAVDEHGSIEIYEYTTRAEDSCGIARLSRRGHCSDKSIARKVFHKLVNFHECPIRLVTWLCAPDSELGNYDDSNQQCGIEGSVVQLFAKKVNATPILLIAETPEDVRRLVAKRYADLGFGRLDIRSFEGVSYSEPYMFVQATVVASHSTWTLNRSFGNILQPLEIMVWVGIAVTMVLILILRGLILYFRGIDALQLFGLFLAMPVPRPPRGISRRIYFVSLVLFGYLCSQSYLTNLTKVLSAPQQQMIRTLADLEKSTLRVIGPADSRERFKSDYPRIYCDFQVHAFSEYYDSLFELLHGRSNSAYYIEEVDRSITEWKNVEAIKDRFNWYGVASVAPNTSVELRARNDVFLRIRESGILSEYTIFIPPTRRSTEYPKPTSLGRDPVLDLEELKDVFLLLFVGLGFSFFVFLIEIITPFIKKRPGLEGRGELGLEWPGDISMTYRIRRRHFLRTDIE